MNDYIYWSIAGHDLEYYDDTHTYLCDGVMLPSITECLKLRFGDKYSRVNTSTLQNASEKGTEMHRAIEEYCQNGTESDLKELRNFKFLQRQYGFEVVKNEIPVVLFVNNEPALAGRLDMVISLGGRIGIADLKRTSALDKEYLGYQLNLYRIAYRQSYGAEAQFLRGIHLREDVRKFVEIPINEQMAMELVQEYLGGKHEV